MRKCLSWVWSVCDWLRGQSGLARPRIGASGHRGSFINLSRVSAIRPTHKARCKRAILIDDRKRETKRKRERKKERERGSWVGSLVNECWFWGTFALCELHRMINDKFPLHFADDDRDAMQTYCLSYSNAKILSLSGWERVPQGVQGHGQTLPGCLCIICLAIGDSWGAASRQQSRSRARGPGSLAYPCD